MLRTMWTLSADIDGCTWSSLRMPLTVANVLATVVVGMPKGCLRYGWDA